MKRKSENDIFWDLAQQHTHFLYNVAFKYTGNRFDAEDLIQEALFTGCKKFYQLQDRKKFKSWIFIILRNHFLKMQRKKKPAEANEYKDELDYLPQLESAALQQDVMSAYDKKETAETVQAVLDKLPEKYKTVLILYFMEDSSYKEIAKLLSIPVGTVMSRLSRAKQTMKKALLKSAQNELKAGKVVTLNIRG